MGQFILAPENRTDRLESFLAQCDRAGVQTVHSHVSDGLSVALSSRVDGSMPEWQEDGGGASFTVGSRSPGNRGAFAWAQSNQEAAPGAWRLGADRAGNMQIFYLPDGNTVSSSFMGCAALAGDLTLDIGACYEFVWNGCVFGEQTLFKEIRRLSGGDALAVSQSSLELERAEENAAHILQDAPEQADNLEDMARQEVEKLRTAFSDLSQIHNGRVRSALSGGYDSRLILALLLDQSLRPELFVYGDDTDADVRIANQVARAFDLDLDHRRKTPAHETSAEFAERVDRDLIAFDGRRDEGIFNSGADYPDRKARHAKGAVVLNGGLGEIYRNFFYLPDRGFTPDDVISAFFARFDPGAMTALFEERAYRARMKRRFASALGHSECLESLTRPEIEALYPLVRGRDWTARETSLSQRFGPFLTPFLDLDVIQGTPNLPIEAKSFGRLEGRMIALLNPMVASIPGANGFPLFGRVPPLFYRLRHLASSRRPIALRRKSYRVQHRLRARRPRPAYLANERLSQVMDTDFPYMRQLFRLENIRDWTVFNRVATLELLAQRLDVRWPEENS
ncbi:MAG: hypothetical protein R3360_04195 [Alphaproteobacteria bacterium]|nr:hypothetical protein [Alphaproteobacteria bacterium]